VSACSIVDCSSAQKCLSARVVVGVVMVECSICESDVRGQNIVEGRVRERDVLRLKSRHSASQTQHESRNQVSKSCHG
jgi:hypothetical protein